MNIDSTSNPPVDTNVDADDISLDDFEKEFYGHTTPEEDPDPVEPVENDPEAPEDVEEQEEDFEPEPEPEPEPVKKKSKFQERIDQLTEKNREAAERAAAAERRLDEALARLEQLNPTPKPAVEVKDGAPDHAAVGEDGTPKYPLGEFDPAYIRDQANYAAEQKIAEFLAKQENDRRAAEQRASEETLATEWKAKVESSAEKYPDFLDKAQELNSSFGNLDPAFGDYLATTIMAMDFGPDVLYHLANNPAEAQKIANSSPAQATLALGRLEARFALQSEDKQEQRLKVSKAPEPPKRVNKGTAVVSDIPDDTDDLDAFEQKFFSKRRF